MCNKCNGNCNSCNCTCITPDCACKVFISTDCVTLSEDLTCSNIMKGQTETEVLKQLDAYICERFETVENFFQIVNVGGGSEIYKGISAVGKKELRTLVDSNLINLVQDTNTITISVDEAALSALIPIPLTPPLEKINEGNGDGIIIRGRTAANYGNIGSKAVDLSDSFGVSSTRGATGAYSFAANDSTTASNYGSVAFGIETVSSGEGSFASGGESIASGLNAVAIGREAEASGSTSFASGSTTIASGQSSNATNERTSAQGDFSSAQGYNSDALGKYSFAGGQENTAVSYGETSIGYFGTQNFSENPTSIVATDRLFNIGNGTNNFLRSNAFTILKNGLATLPSVTNSLITAGSPKSIVTREYLEANLPTSLVPPLETITVGTGSGIIIRGRNEANYGDIGLGAIDLSNGTIPSSTFGATGSYSVVSGGTNGTASGSYSAVTGGQGNKAVGDNSTVSGAGNTANAMCEWVGGSFSTAPAGDPSLFVSTDRIFNVGNGQSIGFLSDAFTIIRNGLATLPSVTNALIEAASGKAIVTKEYLTSTISGAISAIPSPDGSETKVQAGTNTTVTGTGTAANPYIINSTESGGGTAARYTPVVTLGVNTTAPLVTSHTYTRIGSAVTVAGTVNVSILTSGDASTFYISLPVNRATSGNFIVGFGSLGISQEHVTVSTSDTATAMISFTSINSSNVNATYSFTYLTTD